MGRPEGGLACVGETKEKSDIASIYADVGRGVEKVGRIRRVGHTHTGMRTIRATIVNWQQTGPDTTWAREHGDRSGGERCIGTGSKG